MTAPAVTLETLSERIDEVLSRLDAPEPRFLSVEAAAAYMGLSADSVRRMLATGKLRPVRFVPGRVSVDRQQIDELGESGNGRRLRSGRGIRLSATGARRPKQGASRKVQTEQTHDKQNNRASAIGLADNDTT